MDILITDEAFEEITQAVRQGQRERLEFGGSLMAHERDGKVLVAYALPTGPMAEQGPGHLRTDAGFQNTAIVRIHDRWPKLSYVGDWHVHPMWLPELSCTDRRTARAILLDDAAERDHLILLLGTAPPKGDPVVMGFIVGLDGSKGVRIDKADVRRVAGDGDDVFAHLGCALPPIRELLASDAQKVAKDADELTPDKAESHPTAARHEAAARIGDDLEEIRRELTAEATLWTAGDDLGAVVRRGAREAVIFFPPEYPLGAPQVFSGSLEHGPLEPTPLPYAWSSRHRLVDPVAEALGDGPADGQPRSGILLAVLFHWSLRALRSTLRWARPRSLAAPSSTAIAPEDAGP